MPSDQPLSTFAAPADEPRIVLSRLLDAPRGVVFAAINQPEQVKRWWGPRRTTLIVCEMDVRVGGRYRLVQRDEDGSEYEFFGEYRELAPPDRCVFTETFAAFHDSPSVVTVTLTEESGKTRLTSSIVYPSLAVREIVLQTGMRAGAEESYDRLAELLDELK